MLKITLLSLLLLVVIYVNAQTTHTGFQIPEPPSANSLGKDLEVFGSGVDENTGDLVLVGSYNGDVPGYPPVNENSNNATAFFISRYSNETLLWAIQPDYNVQNPIAVDANGDVFANGFSQEGDGFIYVFAKYNGTDGSLIWSRFTGEIFNATADTYCATDGNNLFVFAPFSGLVDFLDESNSTVATVESSSNNSTAVFIAKYAGNGTFEWVKQSQSNDGASITAEFIAADSNGNSYPLGSFSGCSNCSFDSLTLPANNGSEQDGYLLKVDPNGNFEWDRVITSEQVSPAANVVDPDGNIVNVGSWVSNSQPLESEGTSIDTANGVEQAFIAKFTPAGDLIYLNSTSSDGDTTAQSVDCEQSGSCWFTGAFSGLAFNFGNVSLDGNATSVNQAYFAEVSDTGIAKMAFTGSGPSSQGTAVSVDRARDIIYGIGTFTNTENIQGFAFDAGNQTKSFVLQFTG